MSKKFLYISPHLDDAVLSCGQLINSQTNSGKEVEILTLMAGPPTSSKLSSLAKELHQAWSFGNPSIVVTSRRKEDLAAAAILRAKAVHLDIPDAIYRTDTKNRTIYNSFDEIFGYQTKDEDLNTSEILAKIESAGINMKGYEMVLFPLGAGGHVDHILARKLGELLSKSLGNIYFYEDIYVLDKWSREKAFQLNTTSFTSVLEKVDQKDIDNHTKSSYMYTSQIEGIESGSKHTIAGISKAYSSFSGQPNTYRYWRIKS